MVQWGSQEPENHDPYSVENHHSERIFVTGDTVKPLVHQYGLYHHHSKLKNVQDTWHYVL